MPRLYAAPRPLAALLLLAAAPGLVAAQESNAAAAAEKPLRRIAFGSCFHEDRPVPAFGTVRSLEPDLFVLLGDNVYGDTEDMAVLRAKWDRLAEEPNFAAIREAVPVLATWDDHDYGANDAGADYPMRAESQQVFLDFLGEPAGSERRATPGVYDARTFGPPGKRVQVILLDTRYFRSPLARRAVEPDESFGVAGPYAPNEDPDATVLGEAQWAWLAERLREPAEVRLLASSVQVVSDEHGWEGWGLFPAERARLLGLIGETGAGGVIVLSGDRHSAEISRLDDSAVGYPLYDLTASSFNAPAAWKNERNPHRLGSLYGGTNFGFVEIDWGREGNPRLSLQIRDQTGRPVVQDTVRLDALHP